MANIARFNPFFDVDGLLLGFRLAPLRWNGESEPKVKADVNENNKAYTIHAEVPGAKQEDLKVTIDGNQVAIRAEVKRASEEKAGGRAAHSERYYGNLYRSFSLDSAVDEAGGLATYKDGVLDMVLPKTSGGEPTK